MLSVPAGVTPRSIEQLAELMNERLAGYKLTDAQNTLLPLLKEEIGVIGPTRMDYGKVVAVLKCVSENLSNVLSDMLKKNE